MVAVPNKISSREVKSLKRDKRTSRSRRGNESSKAPYGNEGKASYVDGNTALSRDKNSDITPINDHQHNVHTPVYGVLQM